MHDNDRLDFKTNILMKRSGNTDGNTTIRNGLKLLELYFIPSEGIKKIRRQKTRLNADTNQNKARSHE